MEVESKRTVHIFNLETGKWRIMMKLSENEGIITVIWVAAGAEHGIPPSDGYGLQGSNNYSVSKLALTVDSFPGISQDAGFDL